MFNLLRLVDSFFWGYCAFVLIMAIGLFFTIKSNFFQIRQLPQILKIFIEFAKKTDKDKRGVHPLKAFFASTGGMIGIGNVVGIVTAIQMGGPGALVWVWIAGLIGAIVKYSEIFLGFKYRVENKDGSYDGGPMYFLKKAFPYRFIPILVAGLLCIYGVEVYQFSIITDSVSQNWNINRFIVIAALLGPVLYASSGGVQRIGKICSWVMPFFLLVYLGMGMWVLIQELHVLPALLVMVFKSAFTGHAAVGGFAGSSVILAIQYGTARAAYSADIGVGYDSVIQSESRTRYPEKQAKLAMFGTLIDNLICTLSILIILVSGVWTIGPSLEGSEIVQLAFEKYFPYMQYFLPLFFIVTGYTTIIAFFVVGIKCARYLTPRYGKSIYIVFGILSFTFFSYVPQSHALLVMSVSGAMLLIINLLGMYRLRHEILFSTEQLEVSVEDTGLITS